MGGSVSIVFSVYGLNMVMAYKRATYGPVFFEIQVRRLGLTEPLRVLRGPQTTIQNNAWGVVDATLILPTILDAPAASLGTVTYVAELVIYAAVGGPNGTDFRVDTTHEVSIDTAACQILGVKR